MITAVATLRLAYRCGVTVGVTPPSGSFVRGSSTVFLLCVPDVLANGTILCDVAVRVVITKNSAHNMQIAALRAMSLGKGSPRYLTVSVGCLVYFCVITAFG